MTDAPSRGRIAFFADVPWTNAPSLAALTGAAAVAVEPAPAAMVGLDAVVWLDEPGQGAAAARAREAARRAGLPLLAATLPPLGPTAPAVIGAPPVALRLATDASADPDPALAAAVLDLVLAERLMAPEAGGAASAEAEPAVRRLVVDAEISAAAGTAALRALFETAAAGRAPETVALLVPRRPAGSLVLSGAAKALGAPILIDDGRPDLLAGIEAVYALDHPLADEARLAGIAVVDGAEAAPEPPLPPAARAALAARLFLNGVRYAEPLSGRPLSPLEGLARLAALRRRYAGRVGSWVGFGFSAQKARTATTFLAGWRNEVAFAERGTVAEARRNGAAVVAWGAKGGAALEAEAARSGVALSRLEDGFVRSVGLGTRQTIPASLALDDLGLYYDARRPSRFERLAAETDFTAALEARARALREAIVDARVTKYNLGARPLDLAGPAAGRRIVLVFGQVPDDAAIRFGTVSVTGNLALLAAVRAARPDAFVVYKEHPDLVSRSRAGWLPERLIRRHADMALTEGDAVAAIEAADEIHTLTSLAGFEALIRFKPVTCWGIPFYAGWGLTEDREPTPRRGRVLTLDQLVAVALILYPVYVDPVTRLACEAEDVVARIRQIRDQGLAVPPATRFRRLVRATVVAEAWIRHLLGHKLTPR